MTNQGNVDTERMIQQLVLLERACERVRIALQDAISEDAWQKIDELTRLGVHLQQQLLGLRCKVERLGAR